MELQRGKEEVKFTSGCSAGGPGISTQDLFDTQIGDAATNLSTRAALPLLLFVAQSLLLQAMPSKRPGLAFKALPVSQQGEASGG